MASEAQETPRASVSPTGPTLALSLAWTFGYNKDLVSGVHSLCRSAAHSQHRKAVFFTSGNNGVIHTSDSNNNDNQVLLQGHVNAITAVAVSDDKKWIVTADAGKDSLLVVWDSDKTIPAKILVEPHPEGVHAVDITPDTRFIVTLSSPLSPESVCAKDDHAPSFPSERAAGKRSNDYNHVETLDKKWQTCASTEADASQGSSTCSPSLTGADKQICASPALSDSQQPSAAATGANRQAGIVVTGRREEHSLFQSVAVWNWRAESTTPVSIAVIATPDVQHTVLFNRSDVHEILTNGKRRVFFWFWSETTDYFHFYSPALQAKDFKQRTGNFTQSIFLPNSTRAATGTVDGDVVLWDLSLIVDGLSRPDERRAVRILKLNCAPVTVLFVHKESIIVAGFADGVVSFYDMHFRVLQWFEDLKLGQIHSISFDWEDDPRAASFSYSVARNDATKFGGHDLGLECQHERTLPPAARGDECVTSFLVSTEAAEIYRVSTNSSSGVEAERTSLYTKMPVFQGADAAIQAIETHPTLPLLFACGASGFLKIWHYESHRLILHHKFDKLSPTVVTCSKCGSLLAVGFSNGLVKLYSVSEARLRQIIKRHEGTKTSSRDVFENQAGMEIVERRMTDAAANNCSCQERKRNDKEERLRIPDFSNASLIEVMNSRESRESVTHVSFSDDANRLAVARADRSVCLYNLSHRMSDPTLPLEWLFAGKHRSHWRRVTGLAFCSSRCLEPMPSFEKLESFSVPSNPGSIAKLPSSQSHSSSTCQFFSAGTSGGPRLFSVGEDRRMVEYDVANSTEYTGLMILTSTVVEQQAVPRGCLCFCPTEGSSDIHVLIYNSEYKLKIWSANLRTCLRTIQAPMHGQPLSFVDTLKHSFTQKTGSIDSGQVESLVEDASLHADGQTELDFLVFCCEEKLLGLIQTPLDGNPHKAVSLVAHPRGLTSIAVEKLNNKINPAFVFSSGGDDCTVNQWKLNLPVLMASVQRGGDGIQAYRDLIPGGLDGDFYRDMKDYFCYSQLRSEGEDTTRTRRLDGTIPAAELANILCATGECPSQMDIQNLITEAKALGTSDAPEICQKHDRVSRTDNGGRIAFEEFVQLYLNHRAAVMVDFNDVVRALRALRKKNHNMPLTPEFLTHMLTKIGEKMSVAEFERCVETLCGKTSLLEILQSTAVDEEAFARKVLLMEPLSKTPSNTVVEELPRRL